MIPVSKTILYIRIMLLKEQVIKIIAELPENSSAEEMIEKIIFIDKVEKGLEQAKEGKLTSDAELDAEIEKW